jgi:hypothetical protein
MGLLPVSASIGLNKKPAKSGYRAWVAGQIAKFTLLSLCGIGLACASTQSGDDQRVERLEQEVATLSDETARLRSELGELKAKLDKQGEREARLDELRERRERRRAERKRPDLRDPFGDRARPEPGPATPLPLPGAKPADDQGPDPIKAFVDSVVCETGKCSFSRQAFEVLLVNPASLAKSARVVPAVRDGQTQGFKLFGIRPDSVPKALGLENGDLLLEVNGNPLASLDQTLELYTKLRDASTFNLLIERKGKRHTLELTVK